MYMIVGLGNPGQQYSETRHNVGFKMVDYLVEKNNLTFKLSKWKGGMELELIRTQDNKFYVIEINPRIPAWVYLAVGAGQNIPEALVKLAMGMKVEPMKHYETGKMFIRYSWDMITDVREFEKLTINGEL